MTLELFDPAELPALDGDVFVDDAMLARASQDWGRIVAGRPCAVVRPASVADVAAVLGFAAARSVPVAARGAGHSPFGQGQADGGIVLDMTSLRMVHTISGDAVVVDAGARWEEVLAVTLPHALTPPVLTDYLELTVGGTLAVGGIGGASQHHGTQTDTVAGLEVVTGTGELVRCSPRHNRELFDAVRAGLGQCGVITRATVRLLPAQQRARRRELCYDSLSAFLADARTAVRDGRFEYLEGQCILDDTGRWRYMLEAGTYYSPADEPDEPALLAGLSFDRVSVAVEDTTYLEFLDRLREGEEYLRAEGSWWHPHPWLNLFLPDHAVETIVAETFADTRRAELGDSGLVMLYPVRSQLLRTPLLRVPSSELVWLFALLRTGKPDDPVDAADMVARNTMLYRRAQLVGGSVYPANALPMTPQDWQDHFGPAWNRLATSKKTFDPRSILAPGQGVFAQSTR